MKKLSVVLLMLILGLGFAGETMAQERTPADIANEYFDGKMTKEDAIAHLSQEAENQNEDDSYRAWALSNRAFIHLTLGNIEQANSDAERAIILDPDTIFGYEIMAKVSIRRGNYSDIIKYYDIAINNCAKAGERCTSGAELQQSKAGLAPLAEAIDAAVFHKEFQDNLFAAEEKYFGKLVIIKGNADSIGRTIMGNPEITLSLEHFKMIKCEINPQEVKTVAKIKKDDDVVVFCNLKKGGEAIVYMEKCYPVAPRLLLESQ